MKKILIKSDGAQWVLTQIKRELEHLLINEINFLNFNFFNIFFTKEVLFLSKYDFLKLPLFIFKKIFICIFHIENDKFLKKKIIRKIIKNKNKIKIIVSNKNVRDVLIKNNIDKDIIFLIPISFDNNIFYKIEKNEISKLRKSYNISNKIKLIGSFQKDGNGWGEGATPKKIKDPDTFIKCLKSIRLKYEIFVILSGPSRGYVINCLKKNKINFLYFKDFKFEEMYKLYNMIDIYLITSLEEGGPRALLESMSCGTPVISTKVGQSNDIIDKTNGFLVDKKDYNKMANFACDLFENSNLYKKISNNSIKTAMKYEYSNIKKNWISVLNV